MTAEKAKAWRMIRRTACTRTIFMISGDRKVAIVKPAVPVHAHLPAAHESVKRRLVERGLQLRDVRPKPALALKPLAEAAAYSGGGSASGLRMTTDPVRSVPLVAYREFFRKWNDLYEGYLPFAQIGISAFSDQDLYVKLGWLSHSEHLVCTREISTQLAESHLSRDFVVRRAFTPKYLKQYRAVVLCKAQYMDQEEVDAARTYAEKGGVLMLVGDNGLYNYQVEKRDKRPFADLEAGEPLAGCGGARVKAIGKGKVAYFAKA